MQLTILKSKIHRGTVTGASLHYQGSLTISSDLAGLVDVREYEKILVGNLNNGERFETYVIYGEAQKGLIELNGATAHLGKIGDRVTIMNFGSYSAEEAAKHQPRILVLDEKNRVGAPRRDRGGAQSRGGIKSASSRANARDLTIGQTHPNIREILTVCAARDDAQWASSKG